MTKTNKFEFRLPKM